MTTSNRVALLTHRTALPSRKAKRRPNGRDYLFWVCSAPAKAARSIESIFRRERCSLLLDQRLLMHCRTSTGCLDIRSTVWVPPLCGDTPNIFYSSHCCIFTNKEVTRKVLKQSDIIEADDYYLVFFHKKYTSNCFYWNLCSIIGLKYSILM